jgi:hypothetical protein
MILPLRRVVGQGFEMIKNNNCLALAALGMRRITAGLSAGLVLCALASLLDGPISDRAHANTLTLVSGSAPGLDIDLTVTVSAGVASFLFTNNSTGGAANSAVHEIYFESGLSTLLKTPVTLNAAGTHDALFAAGAKPAMPPGLNPWTNFAGGPYGNVSKGGNANANMISVGDSWAITFALVSNTTTVAQILNAIFDQNGHARIAMHIGDCVRNSSCVALIAGDDRGGGGNPDLDPVPLPAALPLFATVIAGGGIIGWRRKRKQLRAA